MVLLLALVTMGHARKAEAQQSLYWSGTAGTTTPTWNTPLAWSTNGETWVASPTTPGGNDTAVLGIAPLSGPQLIPIAGAQSVHGLVFRSPSPTAFTGTGGSAAITLGSGGITLSFGADGVEFGLEDQPATAVTVALSGSMGQRWNNETYRVPRLNGPLVRGGGATLTFLGQSSFALRTSTNTFGMLGPWASYEGGPAVGRRHDDRVQRRHGGGDGRRRDRHDRHHELRRRRTGRGRPECLVQHAPLHGLLGRDFGIVHGQRAHERQRRHQHALVHRPHHRRGDR